ncbi:hypothetical protein SteCoe_14031 [Stentor coeruleus]|uniref:Uncharacterized protein n=1 Tax=Stentor coeruleus TaxID=5963 RepID=A0A1R2C6Z5_9CILI|nr:hypothetical protein SteCoe_14031 [Stentor coeruleus]
MSEISLFTGKSQNISVLTSKKPEARINDEIYSKLLLNISNKTDSLSSQTNECKIFKSKTPSPNGKYTMIFTPAVDEYTSDTILREENTLKTLDLKYLIPFTKICKSEDIEKSKYRALRHIKSLRNSVNKLDNSVGESQKSFSKDDFTNDLHKRITDKLAKLEEKRAKKHTDFNNSCCLF